MTIDESSATWASAQRQLEGGLLSVIMPAYRLGAEIANNVRIVRDSLAGKVPFEIVVVDDGSPDSTGDELERAAGEIAELRPVRLPANVGKGAALRHGFEASAGSYVLLLDGDLDLPPDQVSVFFTIMENEGSDVVIGSKRHPDSKLDYPWQRQVISTVYYGLVKLLIGLPIRDTQTGIKLFKREVLEWTLPRMLVKRFAFDLELLAIAHQRGFSIAESPVTLEFRGTMGCIRTQTVRQVMTDTLAIFYRVRILDYYASVPDLRMPDPQPLVSVIVPCSGTEPFLSDTVAAIASQTYEPLDLVLVPDEAVPAFDNATVDQVASGPASLDEKRRHGLQHARGDVIAFLASEALPAKDWLEKAMRHMSNVGTAAVCGPIVTHGCLGYAAELAARVTANPAVCGPFRYRYVPHRVREVNECSFGNVLVRADDLRITGDPPRLTATHDEDRFTRSLIRDADESIVYEPLAIVVRRRSPFVIPYLGRVLAAGRRRGRAARRLPWSGERVWELVSVLLIVGVVGGGLLALGVESTRGVLAGCAWIYAILTAVAAASPNPLTWLLTWIGIMATHAAFGTGYIVGRLRG